MLLSCLEISVASKDTSSKAASLECSWGVSRHLLLQPQMPLFFFTNHVLFSLGTLTYWLLSWNFLIPLSLSSSTDLGSKVILAEQFLWTICYWYFGAWSTSTWSYFPCWCASFLCKNLTLTDLNKISMRSGTFVTQYFLPVLKIIHGIDLQVGDLTL